MQAISRKRYISALLSLVLALGIAMPAQVAKAATTTIVTPLSADWVFINDNGTTGDYATGFETGPGTPPAGTGSAYITLNSSAAGIVLFTQKYQGTRLDAIETLTYSTYTNLSPAAMTFQINYDPDITDANTPWYGRLIYEPYMNGTVTNGSWQTWDMLNGGAGKWWASSNANTTLDTTCGQSSPCTLAAILALFPNIGIRADANSGIMFKAGSTWNGFDGNIDNLNVQIAGNLDTYNFEPLTDVYVDDSWSAVTPGTDPDGAGPAVLYGVDSFSTIQEGIDTVGSNGTVHVAAGTYSENLTVNKSLTLAGGGVVNTIIQPAVSNPNCGGAGGGSLCDGSSNVILVQADNVIIHDLTVDGDNPALIGGFVVGGANVDARNGIITNHAAGTFNGLEVYNTLIRNVYLRGLYASSGGTFNFHNNTVTNVRAEYASIGIFAWGGPGTISNNTVSYANDAISANHSKGIQFLNNTVTQSGSGVHTDNAGDSAGSVADLIQGNSVSDCSTDGYGIWTFVNYLPVVVQNNTVSNCTIGLSAWGTAASVTFPVTFTENVVTGPNKAVGSVGAFITTSGAGWGYFDLYANFTNNTFTNFEHGVQVDNGPQTWEPDPYVVKTAAATLTNNQISNSTTGIFVAGSDPGATGSCNQITGNTDGVNNTTSTVVDFEKNWWGDITGPSGTGPGSGDTVSANVDYSPWNIDTSCVSNSANSAIISVGIGGINQGTYGLPFGVSTRQSYDGSNGGPLQMLSTNSLPLIASQRVIYGGKSYSEMMGLPLEQLSKEYWFPYYNNVAMNSQLRISNLGDVPTTITVYLGTQQIDSYTLAGGSARRWNYADKNGGPLRVTSSNTNILATIRVLYNSISYSELMGLPVEQLTKEYLFPYYNNVAMNSQLRVSNLGNVPTAITVYLGSTPIDSYTLGAGGATRKNYPSKNGGPLRVISSDTNILSTIRVLYNNSSYSELMGYPANKLAQEYWYPVYDNSSLNSQLRVSNMGTGPTTIKVYLGSDPTPIDSYSLGAGGATRRNYVQNSGPLHVVSSSEPILSTIRMLYTTPSFSSFYEMTGLPDTQLSTQYFFPWYNNIAMNSELRFAAP